jgi:2-oxoglutarate dehydrogenase E2 component (dihydrolipoamide succinyltransferase)
MVTKVIMPQLGESVVEGTVVKWLHKVGDEVEEFDNLLEVESAKVSTEIPSPATGTILKILVNDGNTVKAGTIIAWIGEQGEKVPAEDVNPESKASEEIEETEEIKNLPSDIPNNWEAERKKQVLKNDLGFISPVVARMVKEHNIDLNQIRGTGKDGRITKKDVSAFLETNPKSEDDTELAAWETPGEGDLFRPAELQFPERFIQKSTANDDSPFDDNLRQSQISSPAGHLIPHTNMRKAIANHMTMSKQISPHVTTVMEADMKQVDLHRANHKNDYMKQKVKLTYTAYFVAATISALKTFPIVNSSWKDDGVLIRDEINIGLAVSLGEAGLIVPVIKHADSYSLLGLAKVINELSIRARNRNLSSDEIRDGTFTITNHGTSGSLFASPIINQPQCAILGVGAIKKRPIVVNDAIAIRSMVYLSLTFDHRVLDGASADGFLAKIVEKLENWH